MSRIQIPNDRIERIRWLEKYLVSTRIHSLADELAEYPTNSKKRVKVESLIGDKSKNIADFGLSALNDFQLQKLLRHPRSLPQLQVWLLMNGGKYWEQRFNESRFGRESVEMQRKRIENKGSGIRRRVAWIPGWLFNVLVCAIVLGGAGALIWWTLQPSLSDAIHFEPLIMASDQGDAKITNGLYQSVNNWSRGMNDIRSVKKLQAHIKDLLRQLKIVEKFGCLDGLTPEGRKTVDDAIFAMRVTLEKLAEQSYGMDDEQKFFMLRSEVEGVCSGFFNSIRGQSQGA